MSTRYSLAVVAEKVLGKPGAVPDATWREHYAGLPSKSFDDNFVPTAPIAFETLSAEPGSTTIYFETCDDTGNLIERGAHRRSAMIARANKHKKRKGRTS